MENIINLLIIGYLIGFVLCAYFGIVGTNEIIKFKNKQYKNERLTNGKK